MAAPSPDLVFAQAPLAGTPTPLVFGDAEFTAPSITVDVSVTLGGVSVSAFIVTPVRVEALVLLGGVNVSAAVAYDNRVTRYRERRAASPYQPGVPKVLRNGGDWQTSTNQLGGTDLPWDKAQRRLPEARSPHETSVSSRRVADIPWRVGDQRRATSLSSMQTGLPVWAGGAQPWQRADRLGAVAMSGMQTGIFHGLDELARWQTAISLRRVYQGRSGASPHFSARQSSMLWQMAGVPHAGKEMWPPIEPPGPKPGFDWNGDLLFSCPFINGTPAYLVFGDNCNAPVVPGETVIVPVRKVYMVLNDATLRRVDGNIALPCKGMTLNLDADSWTWGFSAALPGRVLDDLQPDSDGAPVEVEALINGVPYRALVGSIGRDRSFGKSDLRVTCRGKTALLDGPYAPSQNFRNVADRTAQQIMGDVLTLNGVPLEWAVDWGLEDWLVPAGVFSQQGSYIAALNAIAQAAGGYIQPHASLQRISVLPRYPVAPWDWNTVTPDFELPSDVTTQEGIEWVDKARYNRVYVSGQQSGVLGQVTRAGTAGDLLAPMVTDALITTAAAARQRGLAVLADTGRQANVTLRLPVLAETGVIPPGKFVRYVDGGVTRLGLVRGTGVEVAFPEIWQTIGVETHA